MSFISLSDLWNKARPTGGSLFYHKNKTGIVPTIDFCEGNQTQMRLIDNSLINDPTFGKDSLRIQAQDISINNFPLFAKKENLVWVAEDEQGSFFHDDTTGIPLVHIYGSNAGQPLLIEEVPNGLLFQWNYYDDNNKIKIDHWNLHYSFIGCYDFKDARAQALAGTGEMVGNGGVTGTGGYSTGMSLQTVPAYMEVTAKYLYVRVDNTTGEITIMGYPANRLTAKDVVLPSNKDIRFRANPRKEVCTAVYVV